MEPRDGLVKGFAGVRCTACGGAVHDDRIRALARRDDIAFVELRCLRCGTRTIGVVTDIDDESPGRLDVAPYGEFGPLDDVRLGAGRPLRADDVLAMRVFLDRWRGDFRTLLSESGSADGASAKQ